MTDKLIVPRSITRFDDGQVLNQPLADYRAEPAYALLGEPGAGKTEAMKAEAHACGSKYIEARHFVVEASGPEWQGKMLFIDGLDEMRAGEGDGLSPLNQIRKKLIELGRPPFRLSCREADWLGSNDKDALERVAPGGKIAVLHLNPLTDTDIEQVLRENLGIPDPPAFLQEARRRGLHDLLRNPQTLQLMTDAVGTAWPDNRKETYELACRKLVQEKNRVHRDARRFGGPSVHEDALLEAAGHLNAVLLLSGQVGFALDAHAADLSYIALETLTGGNPSHQLAALKTGLFAGPDDGERRRPVHRSVAEFLAARHLARKIRHSLPLGRVLALICGHDGGVVPQLRGLHAWLAVHSPAARPELIASDPLGVVLYGDVREFSTSEKRQLLEALSRQAKEHSGFRFQDWTSHPFGALATPDMERDFHDLLASPDRQPAHQALLSCVLDALEHGDPMPALADDLASLVRDNTYWLHIRRNALMVLLRDPGRETGRLTALLAEIHSGQIEDPEDDLLGVMLEALYPDHIPPERVLDYLHPAKRESYIGHYRMFWHRYFAEHTPSANLPALLDLLAQKQVMKNQGYEHHDISAMLGTLLTRGLDEHGASASNQQLFDWLGIGLDKHGFPRLEQEHVLRLGAWFAKHPEKYKAILKLGITHCEQVEEPRRCLFGSTSRLYGAPAPEKLSSWFLQLAESSPNEEIARHCFEEALQRELPREAPADEKLAAFESRVKRHPRFEPWLERYLTDWLPHWRQEEHIRKVQRANEKTSEKREWIEHFRTLLPALIKNEAHPSVLHNLAWAYFGHYYESTGDTPHERLASFLDNDRELIEATLAALQYSLNRTGLPSVEEIIRLDIEGQYHYFRTACLAGAEEMTRENLSLILTLPDDTLRKLLAFRLTFNADETPGWFTFLVQARPDLVAEILCSYGLALLQQGKSHVPLTYALAHEEAYGSVASHAAACLLSGFPLRARLDQLGDLEYLLKAGLRHLDAKAFRSLIADRVAKVSLDAAQRTYWLGAGLVADPETYRPLLEKHLARSQKRARQLAGFFHDRQESWMQQLEFPISVMSLLIEKLAPGHTPDRPLGARWVSPAMETADLVRSLINRLSNSTDKATAETIERLLGLPSLKAWHESLRHARQIHRTNWRSSTFRHRTPNEVEATLANLKPANHADLLALVMEQLRDIALKLRHGASNGYKDFWNLDPHSRCDKPKPENACRDTLLGWLQERLAKLAIDAQPEGQYADNKRADIRVWFGVPGRGGINVPIEIKRDSHKDLWNAIHEQLIPRYARDPGADGYGIYLVFWFGGKGMPTATDGGRAPKSALELEERLRSTRPVEERHHIQVCVLDCCSPA